MAETRKFDYVAVSNTFKNMTEITGDASTPDSIAGILHDIDNVYREYVDKNDMAIYGDLGKQLLLDWDNTSSDFPSFVTNFENWANLIANAAGAYQQFEQDIANTKVNNPLGTSSAGLQQAYTSIGNYSGYDSSAALNVHSFVGLSGMGYIDTDMESYEKQRKTSAMWSFGLNAVSTILSVIGGGKVVGAERAAGKTLTTTVNSIAQNGLRGTLSSSSSAASNVASNAASEVSKAAMKEADDAVTAAANNLENLMKPDSGATQAMIDMAKNELDDALTLQANLRAQQAAAGVANAAMQNADDAVTAAASNLENLMKPDSGATQAMIDMAKNELDDALTLQANLRAQQATTGAVAGSAQSSSLLGAAQAPDMSLSGIANGVKDVINTATTTGGVDTRVYAGFMASKGMEKIKTTEQADATEQTITSTPVNGVMGNNATVTESIYSR